MNFWVELVDDWAQKCKDETAENFDPTLILEKPTVCVSVFVGYMCTM